jgi:hypothetical protein
MLHILGKRQPRERSPPRRIEDLLRVPGAENRLLRAFLESFGEFSENLTTYCANAASACDANSRSISLRTLTA